MVASIQPIIPFPLFEGNDGYDIWGTKMRTLFISEDLWELVDKGYIENEIPANAIRDVRKSDAKALFFIQQAVADSIFPLISKATKSKEAWDSLQTKYQNTAERVSKSSSDPMVASIQPTIPFPLFKGNDDYDIWSRKMRTLFISEDLWELVDMGYVEDEYPTNAIREVRKNDAKALFFIQQAVPDCTFPLISEATKSKEAWDILRTKYQKTAGVAKEVDDSSAMYSSVYEAAAKGDIGTLQEEEISKSDPFDVKLSPQGNTILHIASEFGNLECVEWILSSSYSSLLQHVNLKGETALHLAAREGHRDVVEALINGAKSLPIDAETGLGADKVMLRMLNKEKDTVLHEAVRHVADVDDDLNLVKLLIDEDADFSYGANASDMTPLYMAAERGITGLVKLIIDKSTTSPAYGGLMGRTALHAAVICDNKEMTRTILKWKPSLTKEVDEKGWSPLHCAAERGCHGIVKLLLKKSDEGVVYLKTKDEKRSTALHIAAFHHHWKIVEQLVFHSPGCREQIDDQGNNVFHYAFMKKPDKDDDGMGFPLYSDWLEVRGLKNEKNAEGNAPIHLLALNQISDVSFVWDSEVNLKAYNKENLTAYDIISRAEDDTEGNKDRVKCDFECIMDSMKNSKAERPKGKKRCFQICKRDTVSPDLKKMRKKFFSTRESKDYREKRTAELKEQGGTHLIVSALITTVTFAAGFTLPGGYDSEDGKAVLAKRAAFGAFVATDTIAMLASLCAVFLHFFMTMRREKEFLEAHLVWAFILTMVGMGGMGIAFATGLYAVLPHSSVLALVTSVLCSCFFLSFVLEYYRNWRGTSSNFVRIAFHGSRTAIFGLLMRIGARYHCPCFIKFFWWYISKQNEIEPDGSGSGSDSEL